MRRKGRVRPKGIKVLKARGGNVIISCVKSYEPRGVRKRKGRSTQVRREDPR